MFDLIYGLRISNENIIKKYYNNNIMDYESSFIESYHKFLSKDPTIEFIVL